MSKIILQRDLKPKEKSYKVTIFVEGMMYPAVAELDIIATSQAEAKKWVSDNLNLSAKRV